ncbi:MAG TPA: hypothetical protein VJ828_09265, partial [Lacipirellulaceae bacterium]|nr:hypothetical protein [Lacipirellulaceae bacterium]
TTESFEFRWLSLALASVSAVAHWLTGELRNLTCRGGQQPARPAVGPGHWFALRGGLMPCAAVTPVARFHTRGRRDGPAATSGLRRPTIFLDTSRHFATWPLGQQAAEWDGGRDSTGS